MLERRGRPDARRLFALIHDVNPTGHELPVAVEQTRYALKSRLQSLLIKHFRDDLLVTVDPDHPGVIAFRHRHLGLDACHAVLETLDGDARSWVMFELDVSAGAASSAPTNASKGLPAGPRKRRQGDVAATELFEPLIQRGRDAIEAFDYDTARTCFDQALTRTGGGASAALPMLELLVDLLAADDDALAVESRLSPESHAVPEIRALLALAAARAGQHTRSKVLLQGAASGRVADVLAALTESALKESSVDEAVRWLAALVDREPGHRDRDRYERAVGELRARERAPAEEALERSIEAEDLDAMESRAKGILSRWPESEIARRAMRAVRDGLRRREIARLTADARQALSAGDPDRATTAIEGLRSLGPVDPTLEEALARAIAERTAHDDTRKVAQTVELLAARDLAAGLRAYLALSSKLRACVRPQAGGETLDWIEKIEGSAARFSDKEIVTAVQALYEARSLASGGDPSGALDLIGHHEAALRHVAAARDLLASCRQQIATLHRARATDDIRAAREALAAQDENTARRLLGRIDRAHLDTETLDEAARVEVEIASRIRVRETKELINALLADGDTLGARNEASRLVDLSVGEDALRWTAQRDALSAQVRREWRVCEISGGSDLQELGDLSLGLHSGEYPYSWLLPDGREMVVAVAHGRWVYLRLVDRVDRRVTRRRILKSPRVFDTCDVSVEANGVWVYGGGCVIHLAPTTWEVLRWWDLTRMVEPDDMIDNLDLAPGGRYAWLRLDRGRLRERTRVIDLDRSRVQREFQLAYLPQPLRGSNDVAMVCTGLEPGGRLLTARGTSGEIDRSPDDQSLRAAAPHPSGTGFVALTGSAADSDGNVADQLTLQVSGPHGQWTRCGVIADAYPEGFNALATSRDARMTFAALSTGENNFSLLTLAPSPEGVVIARRMEIAVPVLALVQDAATHHVVAVFPTEEGIDSLTLDADTDALPDIGLNFVGRSALLAPPFFCGPEFPGEAGLDIAWRITQTPRAERILLARILCETHAHEPHRLISLAVAFKAAFERKALREIAEFAYARFSGDPLIGLLRGDSAADDQRWDVVRDTLRSIDDATLDPEALHHRDHLLGLSLLYLGDADEAHRVLSRRYLEANPCNLGAYLDLADVARAAQSSSGILSEAAVRGRSLAARVLVAIQNADRAFARNDPCAAITVLHRPIVLGGRERQSLGRLAAAHLAVSPTNGARWFQKALALAIFCTAHPLTVHVFADLPVPHGRWDDARLDTIAHDAHEWLDRESEAVAVSGPLGAMEPLA